MTGFVKAKRERVWVKIAITGPAGSGKTMSALRLAEGFTAADKIAVIDTENGSASLYSDFTDPNERFKIPAFDVLSIGAPYTTERYIDAINLAIAGGYEMLVIDSISHAWAGRGGLQEQKDILDRSRPGSNQFVNWAPITAKHEAFKVAILESPIHVICTMRSKQEYAQSTDASGKKSIQKLGLAPVQRDGMDYEFTVVFDAASDHAASVSKDRTGLFDGECCLITEEQGRRLRSWRDGAAESRGPSASSDEAAALRGLAVRLWPDDPSAGYMAWLQQHTYHKTNAERRKALELLIESRVNCGAGTEPPQVAAAEEITAPLVQAAPQPASAQPIQATGEKQCSSCGRAATTGQVSLSVRKYGVALCPDCQKERAVAQGHPA